jgi:2-polyprenyl-3-methyl-5-hydroxy-6-metoxy-1,4-benzoquinol methylase
MLNQRKFKQIGFERLEKCPYCSSENIVFLFGAPERLTNLPGKFSIYKCGNCDLVFQNPRVREEYISLYYTNRLGYYNLPKDGVKNKNIINELKKFFKKQTLINHFNYNLGKENLFYFLLTFLFKKVLKIKTFPYFKKQGNLLEIGCSNGELLEEMRKLGWNVNGIEMNTKTAIYAREKRNLEIYNKRIEDCNFNKGEFDVIIMNMLLEHLYNPFRTLEDITLWLKKEGQLIFSIPYFNGFEFKWFKSYCYGLHLPNHVTFFNKKIIRDCLKKLGYKDIKFYHHFFDRDIIASAQYKYQDTRKLFYKMIGYNKPIRFLTVKPFVFLLSLINKTSRITVHAHLG